MRFGVLIYTETLLSLSGNKNWTENVQPALPLDERAVKCFSGTRLGESLFGNGLSPGG